MCVPARPPEGLGQCCKHPTLLRGRPCHPRNLLPHQSLTSHVTHSWRKGSITAHGCAAVRCSSCYSSAASVTPVAGPCCCQGLLLLPLPLSAAPWVCLEATPGLNRVSAAKAS